MASNLSNEEKRKLSNLRQSAVRKAWKEERIRVENGQGTRNWSLEEQKELKENGYVSGYDGHHMKSVSKYPNEAGNPRNIQFLTEKEHFEGAHQGNYHNSTNGYYDPETQTMHSFSGDELEEIPIHNLNVESEESKLNKIRQEYLEDTDNEYISQDQDSISMDSLQESCLDENDAEHEDQEISHKFNIRR